MIKNMVYLDVEKMYSLSSQIFEGVTEYILKEKSEDSSQNEEQKGPIGSGRILGDILRNTEKVSEKKFLIDYSYNIFEEKLEELGKVHLISSDQEIDSNTPKNSSFIKIKSQIVFNDIRAIQNTILNTNAIGLALTRVTSQTQLSELQDELKSLKGSTKNREILSQIKSKEKSVDIKELAKAQGLYHDEEFLKSMSFILSYGFQDQLEIQMKNSEFIFSSILKRNCLREEENLLISKYSRQTEVEFTLFGIVTQSASEKTEPSNNPTASGIKEVLMDVSSHLNKFESEFSGRLSNEIKIDPIAIYTEII